MAHTGTGFCLATSEHTIFHAFHDKSVYELEQPCSTVYGTRKGHKRVMIMGPSVVI